MRRLLLATIVAAALVLPAYAQRGFSGGFRGGMAGGFRGGFAGPRAFGFRGSFVSPRPIGGVFRSTPPGFLPRGFVSRNVIIRRPGTHLIIRTVPNPFFDPFFKNSFFFGPRFGHFRHRHFFGFNPFFGSFPGFFGGWGWGGWGWGGWPGWDSSMTAADYASATDQQRLAAHVDDLEQQLRQERLQRMQEEQDRQAEAEAARAAVAAKPAAPERPLPPTVLVFRDGRRTEVRNYAMVDDTLYEFAPHWTRKVPLADIDVPATVKANDERGLEFRVPHTEARK